MLKHFQQTFSMKPSKWPQRTAPTPSNIFIAYRNKLIQDGYVFRRNSVLHQDPTAHRIILSGIMGDIDALAAATESSQYVDIQSQIAEITESTQVTELDYDWDDSSYCNHANWNSIILMNTGPRLGAPSLVCPDCDGLIAPYRLALSEETLSALWTWERQYDAIDELSTLCSEYETWSDREINDINSKLNESAIQLASQISTDAQCQTYYRFGKMDQEFSACPQCRGALHKTPRGRKCCARCHIIAT